MSRLCVLAMGGTLLVATAVSANFGPPYLPKDHKIADPSVRFEELDKHQDYIFYVSYGQMYTSKPAAHIEVKDSKPIKLYLNVTSPDRKPVFSYLTLLAMDRKEIEKRKKEDPTLAWFNPKASGLLTVSLAQPETSVPVTAKDGVMTSHRIALKDGKLTAEKIEAKGGADEPMAALLPTWAFGVVSSLSVAWLGIWFARRGSSPQKPRN